MSLKEPTADELLCGKVSVLLMPLNQAIRECAKQGILVEIHNEEIAILNEIDNRPFIWCRYSRRAEIQPVWVTPGEYHAGK